MVNRFVGWCHLVPGAVGCRGQHHGLLRITVEARRIWSRAAWGFNFGIVDHVGLGVIFLLCAGSVSVRYIGKPVGVCQLTKLFNVVLESWSGVIRGSRSDWASSHSRLHHGLSVGLRALW